MKEKILIVEDERIIAMDLQRRLERFGYPQPKIVSTGEDAIKAVETFDPDIILMDIMLAGEIDGVEAATIIKETFSVPVIFLTAYSDEKTLSRAKKAEPFGYILKPFKEKELYTTIDIALYKFNVDQTIKRQERWLSAVLHSVEDGIIATDKNGKIRFMNPVAEHITGWNEEAAKEKRMDEVFSIFCGPEKTQSILPDLSANPANSTPFVFKNCILENRNSQDIHVEGSLAVICIREGDIEGQVLAFRDTSEMKRLSETITYQASHDTLTGLINRDAFSNYLERLIKESSGLDINHALLYLDIDKFRVINDVCGHDAGDELLIKTTSIIKTVIRSSDLCARLGGDEFGIILEGAGEDQAMFIAQRLHSRLRENKLAWEKHVFTINTSIGLVMIHGQGQDIHSVLAAADDACVIAKDEGGNRIRVYNTDENLFVKHRGEMQWISKLTKALEEERFVLYFQPIVPLSENNSGQKKGELLLRMLDENNEIIMPLSFIPSAERYNLMPAIDRWVIKTAFRQYKLITDKLGADRNPYFFTINISAGSLADEGLLDYIMYKFQEFEVDPHSFCFEITETAAIGNIEKVTILINQLKSLGCTFALDDFGSGFSSFNYLRNLPVDFLKIDGAFVKDMHIDSVNHAMVEAIHSIGHIFNIKTIAEFVSSPEIITQLKQIGVDFAQGYEIGKPAPLSDILKG